MNREDDRQGLDPWRDPALMRAPGTGNPGTGDLLERGKNLTRRAISLAVLLLFSVLGAAMLAVILILLGVGLAKGSTLAGIMMAVVIGLGVLGAVWAVKSAAALLQPQTNPTITPPAPALQALPADTGAVEARLLDTLRAHERPLSAPARAAFHATVIATRDAVRATAADTEMNRDAFDARQAATEDLPELMSAYQAVRNNEQNEAQLMEQLQLIHTRMSRINAERTAVKQDQLAAHGHYLRDKYRGDEPQE